MSTPPPPGPWGPPPQQPGGWQQPWPATPPVGPPPPKKGRVLTWVLSSVALLVVIAVTAVVAVSCAGGGGNGSTGTSSSATSTSGVASEFASANDTGPVSVITEDPSCAPWAPINNTLADIEQNGWTQRDATVSADVWSPEVLAQYMAVATATRKAADQTVPLAKLTPHRVMRELYEQFIAYSRAYADRVPTYTPPDDQLVLTANAASAAISNVCSAISFGSAAARAPLLPEGNAPVKVAPVGDPTNPTRILTDPNPVCQEFIQTIEQFIVNPIAVNWFNTANFNVPAGQWSPEQKTANNAMIGVLLQTADSFEDLGSRSSNPVFQDFANLTAVYRRAFASAIPTYSMADQYLYNTGRYAPGIIQGACNVAGGR